MTNEEKTDEREELRDALGSLAPVLGRFLWVLAKILFRAIIISLGWLLVGFRQVLFGKTRNELSHWIRLEGDRGLVLWGFVGTVFGGTLLLGMAGVIGVRQSSFITTMFSTIIAGLFSFVPIVIGVNQLTLSWLSGTPDRLRERIESVEGLREDVDALSTEVDASATAPVAFTHSLLASVATRATAVTEVTDGAAGDHAVAVRTLMDDCEEAIEGADDLFDLLSPMLDAEYARLAAETRQLRADAPDEDVRAALDNLDEALVTLDVTRRYFKTLYVQTSLAKLSRQLAYTGTAALMLSTLVVMIYASGYPPVVHEFPLLVLVSLALAGAFSPFAVLLARIVRLATIIQRTVASGALAPARDRTL